jgi:uncharacterized protein
LARLLNLFLKSNQFDLNQNIMDNAVAFITGGTSGIGAAFARHFAQEGYDLILTGRPNEETTFCPETLKETYNINVEMHFAEFSDDNDVAKLEGIIRKNNKIEVLINNAGFGLGKPFLDGDIRNLENMIKVHINAPVRFIHAALPNMIREKKGIIISLSSLSSFIPLPSDSMYSATKLFHNSFMESLHISFRDQGIKVQVLCPGFVRTKFHERAGWKQSELINRGIVRWMRPEKVVAISVRNLRKKNRVIVIPGFWNKTVKIIYNILPKGFYYKLAIKYLQ